MRNRLRNRRLVLPLAGRAARSLLAVPARRDLQERLGGLSTAAEPCRPTPADLAGTASRIGAAIESVIHGKPDAVRLILTVLIAAGHVLIEDVPGVGKTMLAKALGRAVDCSVSRIQFTPDLLPSDITGVSAYVSQTGEFEFRPGPVFASIVVGDEINRASAKTQSALLECMEEQHVTVDGKTYELEPPFMVVATQNPVEMAGTYPLPEAQRDRFTARISLGYPPVSAELDMLDGHSASSPLDSLVPVADAADTSVAMIEKTYSRFIGDHTDALLRAGMFDTETSDAVGKVVPLRP